MLKSVVKLAACMLVLTLAFAGSAFAENRAGATTLTPLIGYTVIGGDLDLEDAASYGFAIGYNMTPAWGLEFDARFTPTEPENVSSIDVDVWSFGLSGLYHFQPRRALNPYLAGGIGGMTFEDDVTNDGDEDFMLYWGGGFKYAMNDTAALRFDVRHIFDIRKDNNLDDQNGDDYANHISAMLGVTFQFGGFGGY